MCILQTKAGVLKKLSYIKLTEAERGLAIIRSLTPLPTSNELNRSPENTLISYHWFLSRAGQCPQLSGAMAVPHCNLTPTATGLMDLIFYQTFQKRLKTFHDTPPRSPFFTRNRGWRTQMGQPTPTASTKIRKKESQLPKKKRKPRADSPRAVNPQYASSL
jgi:hypothetical protein